MSTELRSRMMAAERAGGTGVDASVATDSVVSVVRRRRRARAATGALAVVVALMVASVVATNVGWSRVAPVAAVEPSVAEAPHMVWGSPGQTFPSAPDMTDRAWAQIGPDAALVLWDAGPPTDGGATTARLYALLVVDSSGNARTAAKFLAPDPTLLAWDPGARVALVATYADQTFEKADAELGFISLDGSGDAWVSTCDAASDWHDSVTGYPNVGSAAVPLGNGAFAISTLCPSEFVASADGVRTPVDEAAAQALTAREWEAFGVTDVSVDEWRASAVKNGSRTEVGWDRSAECYPVARPRTADVDLVCRDDSAVFIQALTSDLANTPTMNPARGVDLAGIYIDRLCGVDGVVGRLADGDYGVGVIDGGVIAPLAPDGTRATDCWDGAGTTWVAAGGDLLRWLDDGNLLRVIDLTYPSADDLAAGAGVQMVLGSPTVP